MPKFLSSLEMKNEFARGHLFFQKHRKNNVDVCEEEDRLREGRKMRGGALLILHSKLMNAGSELSALL
jgi:hypothetical protein